MRPFDSPETDAAAATEHDRADSARSALESLFDISPDAIFVTDAKESFAARTHGRPIYLVTRRSSCLASPSRIWCRSDFGSCIRAIAKTIVHIRGRGRWARGLNLLGLLGEDGGRQGISQRFVLPSESVSNFCASFAGTEGGADIHVLVRHFVATHSRRMGKMIDTIPEETMQALIRWS